MQGDESPLATIVDVHPAARRHRLHFAARPRCALELGGVDLLSGRACAVDAPPCQQLLGSGLHWLGRFISHLNRVFHRHRDPSRGDDRPLRVHRSWHGHRDRRNRRDRRRLDDLSGRHAGRHVDDEGREAASDARAQRHRRCRGEGGRRIFSRRPRSHRLQRRGLSTKCLQARPRSAIRLASCIRKPKHNARKPQIAWASRRTASRRKVTIR